MIGFDVERYSFGRGYFIKLHGGLFHIGFAVVLTFDPLLCVICCTLFMFR